MVQVFEILPATAPVWRTLVPEIGLRHGLALACVLQALALSVCLIKRRAYWEVRYRKKRA
jgi:hypothetical protein